MKRINSILAALIILSANTAVFAHGHGGSKNTAHYYGDGHKYHDLCYVCYQLL